MSLNTSVPTNINDTYAVPTLPIENISNKEDKANKGAPNGYAPLDASSRVPSANLPTNLATQAYADGAGLKVGVQWTDRHTTSTGNQYAVGSIVYNAGRVFRCLATNDSIVPAVGGNAYWADLGVGYLLPNENPKIQGGTIEISGGASIVLKSGAIEDGMDGGNGGAILQVGGNAENGLVQTGTDENEEPIFENSVQSGGNAGYIWQNGATGGDYGAGGDAGSINTSAYDGNSGGDVNTGGGINGAGGYINTSNGGGFIRTGEGAEIDTYRGGKIVTAYGGGSINTGIKGSIQLGRIGERTTLNGTASGGDKTITLPNATGTIALASDVSTHNSATTSVHGIANTANLIMSGTPNVDKSVRFLDTEFNILTELNGALISIEALGSSNVTLGSSEVLVESIPDGKAVAINTDKIKLYTYSAGVGGANISLQGTASGTDKTITLPNATGTVALTSDSRFTDSRTPTSHTHGNITNDGKVLVPYGGIISASAVDAFSGAGTYPMIQGSGVGGSIQVASNGAITVASAGTGYVNGLATRAGGSRFNLVTQSTQNASANLPVITTTGGNISAGSFGTTANTFCQGNDARLSDTRAPNAHTHAISDVTGLQTNLDSYVRLTSSEVTFITNSTASADISLFNLSANKTFICSSMTLYFQTGNSVTNSLDTNNPIIRLYETSSSSASTPLMSSWQPSTNSLVTASTGSAYRSNASGEKVTAIATGTSGKTIVAKCTIPTPLTGAGTQCRYASFIGRVIVEGYYL